MYNQLDHGLSWKWYTCKKERSDHDQVFYNFMKIASIINWIYDNRSRLFTFLIRCHAKRDKSNRMDMFFDEVLGGFNSLSWMSYGT